MLSYFETQSLPSQLYLLSRKSLSSIPGFPIRLITKSFFAFIRAGKSIFADCDCHPA
jgi:hypothetical protein